MVQIPESFKEDGLKTESRSCYLRTFEQHNPDFAFGSDSLSEDLSKQAHMVPTVLWGAKASTA